MTWLSTWVLKSLRRNDGDSLGLRGSVWCKTLCTLFLGIFEILQTLYQTLFQTQKSQCHCFAIKLPLFFQVSKVTEPWFLRFLRFLRLPKINPRSCRGTYMAHASGSILIRFSVSSTVFLMILKRSSLEMALLHHRVATLVTDSRKKFLFSSLMMPAPPPVGIFRLILQSCSLLSSLQKPLVGWIYIFQILYSLN